MSNLSPADQLRTWLEAKGLDGYLCPRADRFQGEMVRPCDERLVFLSGFTGSAGMALVTQKEIMGSTRHLLIDGRYPIQAAQQSPDWQRHLVPETTTTDIIQNYANIYGQAKIAYDPWLFSRVQIETYQKKTELDAVTFIPTTPNPLDNIWSSQPAETWGKIWHHARQYSGQSAKDKLIKLRAYADKSDMDAVLITDAGSVCWLLNLRGDDVRATPLVLCYALVPFDETLPITLMMPSSRLTSAETAELEERIGCHIQMFDPITAQDQEWQTLLAAYGSVAIDPATCPDQLARCCGQAASLKTCHDPLGVWRACYNQTEQEGARTAQSYDRQAVTKVLSWIQNHPEPSQLDELMIEAQISEARKKASPKTYWGESFDAIVGAGDHGAIVHYRATPATNKSLEPHSLLLIDCGGQYFEGTTDITRTIAIGTPTPEMQRDYTAVLEGHIAVARARLPKILPKGSEKTHGQILDDLARAPLQALDLDYAHGTGHGVGSFLGVHDGPQSISSRSKIPLRAGMVLSNEPGVYHEGKYGIRLENLILVHEETDQDGQVWLFFETLTHVPFDNHLILWERLSTDAKEWLEEYG